MFLYFRNQRELCNFIIEFLTYHKFYHEVTVKQLMSCSTALYKELFEFIGRLLFGAKFVLDQKPSWQESIVIMMTDELDYPFRLTKSMFVNLTPMGSLPVALGVLDWLICYYNMSNCDVDNVQEEVQFDMIANGYIRHIAGSDGDNTDNIPHDIAEQYAKELQGTQAEDGEELGKPFEYLLGHHF